MTNDSPVPDIELQVVADIAQKMTEPARTGHGTTITVVSGGVVISGYAIPRWQWSIMAGRTPSSPGMFSISLAEVMAGMGASQEEIDAKADAQREIDSEFLYVYGAIFLGGGAWSPATWLKVRIDTASAWFLGEMHGDLVIPPLPPVPRT